MHLLCFRNDATGKFWVGLTLGYNCTNNQILLFLKKEKSALEYLSEEKSEIELTQDVILPRSLHLETKDRYS